MREPTGYSQPKCTTEFDRRKSAERSKISTTVQKSALSSRLPSNGEAFKVRVFEISAVKKHLKTAEHPYQPFLAASQSSSLFL